MTELMERAIDALRQVPDRRQDDIAQVVLQLAAGSGQVDQLSPEEGADLAQSEAARFGAGMGFEAPIHPHGASSA